MVASLSARYCGLSLVNGYEGDTESGGCDREWDLLTAYLNNERVRVLTRVSHAIHSFISSLAPFTGPLPSHSSGSWPENCLLVVFCLARIGWNRKHTFHFKCMHLQRRHFLTDVLGLLLQQRLTPSCDFIFSTFLSFVQLGAATLTHKHPALSTPSPYLLSMYSRQARAVKPVYHCQDSAAHYWTQHELQHNGPIHRQNMCSYFPLITSCPSFYSFEWWLKTCVMDTSCVYCHRMMTRLFSSTVSHFSHKKLEFVNKAKLQFLVIYW